MLQEESTLKIEGCIFGGILFGLPESSRVELKIFAWQNQMVSKS